MNLRPWTATAPAALLPFAPFALAASTDSGTGAVSEISLTGAQLGMLFGAAVALGIVIWLVIKFLNRK